ncbi:MAG: TonB-dependent receptor [Lysobacterales bacterium]
MGHSKTPSCNPASRDPHCDESPIELTPITVTATRRESPITRVPVSVTALSGDRLKKMGALDFEDYARSVPGLSFTDAGFGGQKYVIRGVSTDILSESRAAASVYLDETPITSGSFGKLSYSPDPLLVDIDRVEVLRGPQGTLFGSGSMGGAIRVITHRPNPAETEGFAEARLSTTAHGGPGYEVHAMLNAPLFEGGAAVRGVAYYRNLEGWIDNTALGTRDVNDNETVGLRLAGLWTDSKRLTVDARVVYQDRQSHGNGFDQGDPPWTQQRLVPEPNRDEWSLLNVNIDYRFDWGQLISVTSWLNRTTQDETDGKAVYSSPLITTVTAAYHREQRDFIQEFRLQSDGDQDLDWLLGLFYQEQDYGLHHEVVVPGFDERTGGWASAFGTPDRLLVAQTDRSTEQTAAFGDVIWHFGERWEGSLGGRWFRFEHSSDSSTAGPLGRGGESIQTQASETGFTPKVSLSYLPGDELMLYGTVSGGYRPGGANETVFEEWETCRPFFEMFGLTGIPPEFESDSLWSYELGLKSGWTSRQVYLDAAIFYMDWSDMQTPAALPCGAQWVQNVGEATSKGAEFELVAWPGRNLELRLNGAWTDARLDEDVVFMGGREGDRVPGVPEYAFGGSLAWFFNAFQNTGGSIRIDYQYVGSSPNGYSYAYTPSEIPSYALVNLRLGIGKGRWQATLFLDNLFDERAIITVHDFPEHWVVAARPFTTGISVRYNF